MNDEGETNVHSSSAPSSDTLIVGEDPMEDANSITSTSSSTTVCWIPGGLLGRLLRALGPNTVDLVTRFRINKRLSSISSEINIRLRNEESLSEDETRHFGAAYRVLVDLSS